MPSNKKPVSKKTTKKTPSAKTSSKKSTANSVKTATKLGTSTAPTTSPNRLIAEKKQDLKQLFSHVVVYIAVNIFLIFINVVTDAKNLWFFWVLIGWGIGLAFHWLDVINFTPVNESWIEEEAKKIVKK